jgi:L-ribulose-5-phosphate 4-epimerase
MKLIQKNCHVANVSLAKSSLVIHSFGNISSRIDDKYFTIKPSGANLNILKHTDYPIIRISDNKIIKGKLNPSTDTPTHCLLYKKYPEIGGIAHTHSKFATAWSQAKKSIPILGTTHADYSQKNIQVTNPLKKNQIIKNYEKNIGNSIIDCLKKSKIKPLECPGILVANHAPFSFGINANQAFKNAEILEYIAELAYLSLQINSKSKIDINLIKKHFFRKHGPSSYYGQK